MDAVIQQLTSPLKLWSRAEVLARPCPVPARPGIYAWYFLEAPGSVDVTGCLEHDGFRLLYVGISPKAPPKNGKPPSRQTLRSRIQSHFRGNASGSTLRLTLGCLLAPQLGIELRRVGIGERPTFSTGEEKVSVWMDQNARVCWVECGAPWAVEDRAISALPLPLNIDQNAKHPFCAKLREIRSAAAQKARYATVVLPQ